MIDFLIFASTYLVIGTIIIFIYSFIFKFTDRTVKILFGAILFRIAITYYYYYYTLTHMSDTGLYFKQAQSGVYMSQSFFVPGTIFLNNLAVYFYPFASYFENDYLSIYIPFSICAFVGSIYLYRIIEPLYRNAKKKWELYVLSFFLPNLIYWTSNFGKDSIIFFGIILMLHGTVNRFKGIPNIISFVLGATITYLIRPHVFLFYVIGFLFGLFLERSSFSTKNVFIFGIMFLLFLNFQSKIIEFVGISIDTERGTSATDFYKAGIEKVESVSSGVAIGGASTKASKISPFLIPWYMIRFLGSPFLWNARKPLQFLAALEAIIYQLMVIYIIQKWKLIKLNSSIQFKYPLIMYVIITSIILGAAQSNFGLIIRQKCMVIPTIIIIYAIIGNVHRSYSNSKAKQSLRVKI